MDRKTIAQEYLILAVNEKGKLSLINGTEAKTGMVVAGIMDLLLGNVIKIEKKKIEVVGELPAKLANLTTLYKYLLEKNRTITKVLEDYTISFTDARLKQLVSDTGNSLIALGAASEEKGGLLGGKTLFVPSEEWKESLIDSLKTEVMQKETISLYDLVLISLLKETKILKQYFLINETSIFKEKLQNINDNPDSKMVKEMIGYINEVLAVMIAASAVAVMS